MKICDKCFQEKPLKNGLCNNCINEKEENEIWPELLFEGLIHEHHPCYVCGNSKAEFALYSTKTFKPFIPICADCSTKWRLFGYRILKKINYKVIIKLFAFNLLSSYTIYKNLKKIKQWGQKMKRFSNSI